LSDDLCICKCNPLPKRIVSQQSMSVAQTIDFQNGLRKAFAVQTQHELTMSPNPKALTDTDTFEIPGCSRALKAAAERHGLRCLDTVYRGMKSKLRFACVEGHVTRIAPRNLIRQRRIGCRQCAQIAATERMHARAREGGSMCLSKHWRGYNNRYRLRCDKGHTWSSLGQPLLRGAKCPECAAEQGTLSGALLADGLARLRAAAKRRGGACINRRYEGVQAAYQFQCASGHTWHTRGASVLYRGTWCPHCPRPKPRLLSDGLKRLQAAAAKHGGRCLSQQFLGTAAKHRFECAKGHVWEGSASGVLHVGGWCRHCAYERLRSEDGLQRLRAAAHERGGRCLAERYEGILASYVFQCAEGHTWQTRGGRVLRGTWCPACGCARIREAHLHADGLEQLRAKAAFRGGVCLDEAYLGTAHRYRFRCAKGHEWVADGGGILGGRWCMWCGIDAQRCTIEDARQVARERGGECLSERYVNARSHLTWQCHRGHVWRANFDNVRNKGRWCPDCAALNRITNAKAKARIRLTTNG
jgi:hypothetical protein